MLLYSETCVYFSLTFEIEGHSNLGKINPEHPPSTEERHRQCDSLPLMTSDVSTVSCHFTLRWSGAYGELQLRFSMFSVQSDNIKLGIWFQGCACLAGCGPSGLGSKDPLLHSICVYRVKRHAVGGLRRHRTLFTTFFVIFLLSGDILASSI